MKFGVGLVFVAMAAMPAFGGITYVCDTLGTDLCSQLNNVIAPEYSLVFSNANATIYVQYGDPGPGSVSDNTQFYNTIDYTSYYNALSSHASGPADQTALNSLGGSTNNPVLSGYGVALTSALDSALGILGASGICTIATNPNCAASTNSNQPPPPPTCAIGTANCYNDIITVSSSASFYYDTGTYQQGQYDFFSTIEHETDEALGTSSCLLGGTLTLSKGCMNGGLGVSAMDLFRYSGPGTRSLLGSDGSQANGTTAYFSIDGGNTSIAPFHNTPDGADFGDLDTSCVYVQEAYGCTDVPATPLSIINDGGVEIAMLNAVGYQLTATGEELSATGVPEPGTVGMLALGFGGFFWMRLRRA